MQEVLPPQVAIAATPSTPQLMLDGPKGRFLVEGRSMPENPAFFYEPILEWLAEYATHPAEATELVFRVDYFNTASTLYFLRVMKALQDVPNARIDWHYHPEDEVILEAGELFAHCTKVPFYFIPTKEL